MTIRLRTIWDVRAFSVVVTSAVMLGSMALQNILIPLDIAELIRWPGILISFMIAAPVSYFIGLRMHDIHRLNVHLEETVRHDALTGVLSRHAFIDQVLNDGHAAGVIVMADIDHFKRFNDTYGHAMGDAALKHVARTFLSLCRTEDLVARYGGEEFVLFLPDTTCDDGVRVAERLRHKLRQQPLSHSGQHIEITASFGVSVLEDPGHIDQAMSRADEALYAAKHQGRDCVKAAA